MLILIVVGLLGSTVGSLRVSIAIDHTPQEAFVESWHGD
jgi:hypothetical protein